MACNLDLDVAVEACAQLTLTARLTLLRPSVLCRIFELFEGEATKPTKTTKNTTDVCDVCSVNAKDLICIPTGMHLLHFTWEGNADGGRYSFVVLTPRPSVRRI